MNKPGFFATLTIGFLILGLAAPAQAERIIVEPIQEQTEGFSQAELDQMLAPIALYPDGLLSQVLIAATYPLEIVAAARWSRQNPGLQGEDAVAAVANRDWDPSVKALVAFPDVLAQLDENLEWTRGLGDAMLFQEADVMDSIQFLRARADAAGNLQDSDYVRVIREEQVIMIEPVQTRIVHVPVYNPTIVYGSWWWPTHPPVFWAPPPFFVVGSPGFFWSSGIHVSSGFWFTDFWWPHRSIVVVHTPRFHSWPRHHWSRTHFVPGQRWKHNPVHRRGVAYRHPDVRQRFDQPRLRAGPVTRFPLDRDAQTRHGSRDWHRDGQQRDRQWDRGTRRSDAPAGSSRSGSDWRERQASSGSNWRERQAGSGSDWRDRRSTESSDAAPRPGSDRLQAGSRTQPPRASTDGTARRSDGTRPQTGAPVRQFSGQAPGRSVASPRATQPQQRSTQAPGRAVQTPRATPPPQRSTQAPGRAVQTPRVAPPQRSSAANTAQPTTRAPSRSVTPSPPASSRASGAPEARGTPRGSRGAASTGSRRGSPGSGPGRRMD